MDEITVQVTGPRAAVQALGRFIIAFPQMRWAFPEDPRPREEPALWLPTMENVKTGVTTVPSSLDDIKSGNQRRIVRLLNNDPIWAEIGRVFREEHDTLRSYELEDPWKMVDARPHYGAWVDVIGSGSGVACLKQVEEIYQDGEKAADEGGAAVTRAILREAHGRNLYGNKIKGEYWLKTGSRILGGWS